MSHLSVEKMYFPSFKKNSHWFPRHSSTELSQAKFTAQTLCRDTFIHKVVQCNVVLSKVKAQWNQLKNARYIIKSNWVFKFRLCLFWIFSVSFNSFACGLTLNLNEAVRDGKTEMGVIGSTTEKERELWPFALRYTVLQEFSCAHTPIQQHTSSHTVCLQTSLHHNCSDIYICTWSLSASFHYLEPNLERGGPEWMAGDWNKCGTKYTWKSHSESKLSSLPSDRVTHSVCVYPNIQQGT